MACGSRPLLVHSIRCAAPRRHPGGAHFFTSNNAIKFVNRGQSGSNRALDRTGVTAHPVESHARERTWHKGSCPSGTERSRLRRSYERGAFDRATIYAILDEQPMCSVGNVIDEKPYVTPTLQWRAGDHVYWHGSSASRALRASKGAEVCLTVPILDGYVLARSGFHHIVNARSVMLFATAEMVPDDEEEYALPIWAGEIPVATRLGTPVPDPRNLAGMALPTHVRDFSKR